jgi:hypothetical protein
LENQNHKSLFKGYNIGDYMQRTLQNAMDYIVLMQK